MIIFAFIVVYAFVIEATVAMAYARRMPKHLETDREREAEA